MQHEESQMVNTSWAVLGLIHAEYPVLDVVRKGCKVVMARQQADGSWLQEGIEGVFNKNCAIVHSWLCFRCGADKGAELSQLQVQLDDLGAWDGVQVLWEGGVVKR